MKELSDGSIQIQTEESIPETLQQNCRFPKSNVTTKNERGFRQIPVGIFYVKDEGTRGPDPIRMESLVTHFNDSMNFIGRGRLGVVGTAMTIVNTSKEFSCSPGRENYSKDQCRSFFTTEANRRIKKR